MVQAEFTRDLADADRPIEEAVRERPGKPIKIRFQPMILRQAPGKPSQYRSWPDVTWGLECATAAEAYAIRDVLRTLFETLNEVEPAQVIAALRNAGGSQAGAA